MAMPLKYAPGWYVYIVCYPNGRPFYTLVRAPASVCDQSSVVEAKNISVSFMNYEPRAAT